MPGVETPGVGAEGPDVGTPEVGAESHSRAPNEATLPHAGVVKRSG